MLIQLLKDAGLDHTQIEVMVTDTENTMGKLEKDVEPQFGKSHPCKCHGIEMCVNPWSESEATRPMMKNVRKFLAAFSTSNIAKSALRAAQKTAGQTPLGVIQVVRTRWWSDFQATLRLEKLQPHLDVEEIYAFVATYLSGLEWEFVHQSNIILVPFRDFQIFFEGQFYVTLSWLPVMLEKLRIHLENLAAELDDPRSPRRTRRQLRQHPDLVERLQSRCARNARNLSLLASWKGRAICF